MENKMALATPTCHISDSVDISPFANDLFEREGYCRSLISILENSRDALVICIDAKWGEGKTVFAKMLKEQLRRDGKESVYYNSYRHDYNEDPYLSILSTINSLFKEGKLNTEGIKDKVVKFASKAFPFVKRMGTLTANIAAEALVKSQGGDDNMAAIAKEATGEAVNRLGGYVLGRLNQSADDYRSVEEFREELKELGALVREVQGLPLVIIIDELDRCRPDFAMKIIERIKHFFNVENVTFVLLANVDQLKNYVKAVYGEGVDAHTYLHKFFNLYTKLPNLIGQDDDSHISNYVEKLWEFHNIKLDNNLKGYAAKLFCNFGLTYRDIGQIFTKLVLFYYCHSYDNVGYDVVILILMTISIARPDVFNKLYRLEELSKEDCLIKSKLEIFGNEKENESFYNGYAIANQAVFSTVGITIDNGTEIDCNLASSNFERFVQRNENETYQDIILVENNIRYLLTAGYLLNGFRCEGERYLQYEDKLLYFQEKSSGKSLKLFEYMREYFARKSPNNEPKNFIPDICRKLSTFMLPEEAIVGEDDAVSEAD